jgi:hypothetical protein
VTVSERRDDIELMQYFDGELPEAEARAVAERLERGGDDRAKLEALGQVRDAVRAHGELAADDIERRLAGLWSGIERSTRANGDGAKPAEAATDVATGGAPWAPRRGGRPGDGAAGAGWLERHRGHIVTGMVTAIAVAALMTAIKPRTVVRTEIVEAPAPPPAQVNEPDLAAATSEPPVVENLEITQGEGTILTIPGDEGENPTMVIWLTQNDTGAEEPI